MLPSDIEATVNAAREAFINAATEEVDTPELEAAPANTVESQKPSDADVEEAAAKAGFAAEPKPSEARAYRKLLDGEAKLRAERAAFQAERVAAEAELKELKAIKDRVTKDPVGFLKAAGLSPAQIQEVLQEAQALDMGKLAPVEVQAKLAVKEAERIAREAEERIEARLKAEAEARKQAELEQYVANYQRGIDTFVSSGLSAYPQLAAVQAAGKPVAQAIYQTAVEMAAANPNGPAPTYEQVATQLNSQLAELASAVAPAPTPTTTAPVEPTASTAKPVLRNSSTQAQPSPANGKPQSYEEYKAQIRQKVLTAYGFDT